MTITIIGIDCSTNIKRNGLARGLYQQNRLKITDIVLGSSEYEFMSMMASWVKEADQALLCLDAPLGWPQDMGKALADHRAGGKLPIPPNDLFRRQTDKMIKCRLGKQPLDVGSNFIARTAHYAVGLIEKLSKELKTEISLAWDPQLQGKTAAIEVYPAATLLAHEIPHARYKREENVRLEVLKHLQEQMSFQCDTAPMIAKDDIFDAVLCVLAGVDFLKGNCIKPDDINLAKKEGWIWVRVPNSQQIEQVG